MCVGTCALCHAENVQLDRSHILSRFGYRRLRNSIAANPNPLQISPGQAIQTSRQITEYLLCHPCEQLLANGCENYGAQVAYQQTGDCRVYDLLDYTSMVTPANITTPGPMHVAACAALNTQYLIEFAVSIFWRAAVSQHPMTDEFTLAPHVLEQLRLYLLNHGGELAGIPVVLQVIDQPRNLTSHRFDQLIMVPATNEELGYRMHGFLFNGLYFTMWEGDSVPSQISLASLNLSAPPHLAFSKAANFQFVYSLVALVNTTNWP